MDNYIEDVNVSDEEESIIIGIFLCDLWRGFKKLWWVCLTLIIAFIGAAFYKYYINFTPLYTVSATFTVHTQQVNTTGGGISSYTFYYNSISSDQLSSTFPYIIRSHVLQKIITEEIGLTYLPAVIGASAVENTNLFTLTVTGYSQQTIYDIIFSLLRNYHKVAENVIGKTELNLITPPVFPETPSNSLAYRKQIAISALVGFAIGIATLVLYAFFRNTIRTKDDIRTKLRQNCIAVLPNVNFKKYRWKTNKSILLTNPMIGYGFLEAFRAFRNSVIHATSDKSKVMMVTSTSPGEGKTTVAINLATSIAKLNKKVLLIDCDLRNSNMAKILGIDKLKDITYDKNMFQITQIYNYDFSLLTFNTDKYMLWEILRFENLNEILNLLRDKYDYILIDTPSCGLMTDAEIITEVCDSVIYVIKQDMVRTSLIQNGLESLLSVDAKILGCVFNRTLSGFGGYGENNGYNDGRYNRYGYDTYIRKSGDKIK